MMGSEKIRYKQGSAPDKQLRRLETHSKEKQLLLPTDLLARGPAQRRNSQVPITFKSDSTSEERRAGEKHTTG